MLRLSVSVCRKVALKNSYGSSEGAQCTLSDIEINPELLRQPAELAAKIGAYYTIVESAVNEELERLTSEATPQPTPAPDPASPVREPVVTQAPARTTPGNRPAPTPTFEEFDEDERSAEAQAEAAPDDGPDPTTGGQLLGWARKQPEDMKGYIFAMGKKLKFPSKVTDWNQTQVTLAFKAAKQAQSKRK